MPRTPVSRLLATGAATAALAAGGLVLAPTPAQAAGSASAAYSCSFGAAGTQTVPVAYSVPGLPTTALAGVPLPQLPVTAALTLPGGLAGQLAGPGQGIRGAIDRLVVAVGFGDVPVSLVSPTATPNAAGTTLTASGLLGSMNPGLAGPVPVSFPSAFDLTLTRSNGTPIGTYPCSQATAPSAGTIDVQQQKATVKAKAVGKKIKSSKNGKVSVEVTRQVGVPTGMVYVTSKGQSIGQGKLKRSGGPLVITLDELKPGTYKVKVAYEGDPATAPAAKQVKLTVVR